MDEEEFRRLPGMIALLRGAEALARGDMPEAVKNARRVLDLAPEDAHLMLGGAASVLGLAAWADGDLEAARQLTADGMANVRLAGYISSAIGGAIVLADIQIDNAISTKPCAPMSGHCSGPRSWACQSSGERQICMWA